MAVPRPLPLVLLVAAACAPPSALPAQVPAAVAPEVSLETPAERAGWQRLSTFQEVEAFWAELVARAPEARTRRVGESREGRPIRWVTLSRPAVADPVEAHALGRPVVLIAAQIHGDEPAGKEGLMMFARDLAFGPLNPLLDQAVFVLVPVINPDGAEAATWGTRANRAGYNVNRDYMRLVNPEAAAMVEGVIVPWGPHVIVDAHELTGPRWYDFYTLHPSSLLAPRAPVDLAAGPATEAVRSAIEEAGFTYFPYHLQPSDPTRVPEEGILGAGYGPRQLRVYGGVQGAITLLYESRRSTDAREGIETRARWHRIAMTALARWAAENGEEVRRAVAGGAEEMRVKGARWDPADSIPVRVRFVPRAQPVQYRMPEMRPRAGGGFEATGRVLDLVIPYADSAVAVVSRVRPVGYALEPHRGDLARHLARHGVQVERLLAPARVRVESFRVDSVHVADTPFEGYLPRVVWSTADPATVELPAGTWLVRADQPRAAVAFHFLEPEDEDSFASTGELISEERVGGTLPIHRLVEFPRAPTELYR